MLSLTQRITFGVLQKNLDFHTRNGTHIFIQCYRSSAKLTPHDVSAKIISSHVRNFITT